MLFMKTKAKIELLSDLLLQEIEKEGCIFPIPYAKMQ